MKDPSHWDKTDLHRHLQHALDLELWTIPLYLTALYSIRDLPKTKHEEFPKAAKLIFSVVLQEMLHAELVCNLSHALGYAPKFKHPAYDEAKGIPFIHPPHHAVPDELKGYKVKLQSLNQESLKLFCIIELPHPDKEINWEKQSRYNSQPELYTALRLGIASLWDTCYVGDSNNTKQKNNFKEYNQREHKPGFSIIINSREAALKAIEAIMEQGEGANADKVPVDFRPHIITDEEVYDAAWYRGNLSHYHKFRILLHTHHKLPPVYKQEEITEQGLIANQKMINTYLYFWKGMEDSFNMEGTEVPLTFWKDMSALGNSITEVWQAGMCPDFNLDVSSPPHI